MLGVLKRRWKPKRSGVTRINIDTNLDSSICENDPRLAPSIRQVYPAHDEKVHSLCGDVDSSLPSYPKRASLDSNTSLTQCWGSLDCDLIRPQCYSQAPNICVEAGRIQFIRHDSSDTTQESTIHASPVASPVAESRITVTRGLQTDAENEIGFHIEKKYLEQQISELERTLELVQRNEQRNELIINKLQQQMAKRETAKRDADRERRLRIDSETRSKQAAQEANRCKSRLMLLTTEFARIEETVRSMLVYKRQAEQFLQEKTELTVAFENRCHHYQTTISKLNQEVESLRRQLEQVSSEPNPETALEVHTVALRRHAEEFRKQYEKCLDDVANQVVKALLTQKSLHEEVTSLNGKIHYLESQNGALTSMLVHQLRENSSNSKYSSSLSLQDNTSTDASLIDIGDSVHIKHESFCFEAFEGTPNDNTEIETDLHHSITNSNFSDTKLSSEDKKRNQVLTRLWTELKSTEVTPQKLLEALNALDSALWLQPQRPVSLNLQLPIKSTTKNTRSRSILALSTFKSEEETTGNESSENGNRDEGYSTMSSDVQTDVIKSSAHVSSVHSGNIRALGDLKEATEEKAELTETRLLVTDSTDSDIFYIPLNLLNLKSRNSYPPGRDMLPFPHIMRSFSDSNLCIKITATPSPCYTFTSPISSSPSVFLVDITERRKKPLRKTRTTNTLWGTNNIEFLDDKPSQHSWSSVIDDTEYIQHWLRLDDTRTTIQQDRDFFELEYDRTELEDWSLSLSNDELLESWKKSEATTPGQISISTLPSIQENNPLELEEDSNECLWNNSSYMMDKDGRELVTYLMDTSCSKNGISWPYALTTTLNPLASPDNSWSSGGSDCNSSEPDTFSKRSSAALSGFSDETGETPAIGTDFTRDFYRLVKFESTKSLASTSSRSIHGDNVDREMTLQSVLSFLAEQQKYVHSIEKISRPRSANEIAIRESNENSMTSFYNPKNHIYNENDSEDENYVTLRQLCEEASLNKQNLKRRSSAEDILLDIKPNIAFANEVCLVTPLDVESETCSKICGLPVDIYCSNIQSSSNVRDQVNVKDGSYNNKFRDIKIQESLESDTMSSDILLNDASESLTPSGSTPDTIISKIPRRRLTFTKTSLSPSRTAHKYNETKIPKMKVPNKCNLRGSTKKQRNINVQLKETFDNEIISEKLLNSDATAISNIIVGCPNRIVSFHKRATSKRVMDELNRMIKNGEESIIVQEQIETLANPRLDQSCKPTGWIHVERDIDLTDPKARANLLDVVMSSVSSDSSPTSSCGGSVAGDTTEESSDYGHLHKIHRSHRQKKAKANRLEMDVVRASQSVPRPTIIGRTDFFVRYGDKEREAVASFDFLDTLSTSGNSLSRSLEDQFDGEVKSSGAVKMQFSVTQV